MIRKWLEKHRWCNEGLKMLCAGSFALLAWRIWGAVEIVGQDFGFAGNAVHGVMSLGVVVGLLLAVVILFLIDVGYSIAGILKHRRDKVNENSRNHTMPE